MADDPLDGLFKHDSDAPAATPAAEPTAPASTEGTATASQPAPQPTESQPRAPDGKFASKAQPPAPEPQPAPTPAKPAIDPDQFKGYLDEREKRQAAERERDELRAWRKEQEEQRQATPIPSFQENPDAYAAYLAEQTQRAAISTRFETSETIAREKHGEEAVTSAMDWAMQRAQTSPQFAAEYLKQKHPIDWAVKQQKRDTLLSQLGDDPDEFVRRRYAELTAGQNPEPQPPAAHPQPAAPKPTAPRSLASAQSAGGAQSIPTGPGQAFDTAFSR